MVSRLTSSNYDDEEKKLTGGRNGYGAKLANIYSLEFGEFKHFLICPMTDRLTVVETADKVNGKKYKQVFTNNMSKKGIPKVIDQKWLPGCAEVSLVQISENKKGEEWTKITFTPDLKRFGMKGIDDDTNALLLKRVYDMAGTVRDVKVFLNDDRLKIKGFKQVSPFSCLRRRRRQCR